MALMAEGTTFTNLSSDPKDAQDPRPASLANAPMSPDVQLPDPVNLQRDLQPRALPPGVIPLDQYLAARGGQTLASPGQAYQRYVGQPATNAVQGGLGFMGVPPNVAGPMSRFAVPQTLTQAGVLAGSLGAGGLAAKAGMSGLEAAGARMAGGTLGGAGGGLADTGTMQGAGMGILQGALGGAAGEALGATGSYIKGMGAKRAAIAVNTQDAGRVAQALSTNPRLAGVFGQIGGNPDAFWDLVKGYTETAGPAGGRVINKGQKMLSDMAQQADNQITQAVEQNKPGAMFPDPLATTVPGGPRPSGLTEEQWQRLGDNAKQAWLEQSGQAASADGYVDWATARGNLTKLNEMIRSAQGKEKGDLLQQKAEAIRGLNKYLSQYDPSGGALKAFNQSRTVYDAGTFTLDMLDKILDKSNAVTSSTTPFNSQALQDFLNTHRTEVAQHLGPDGEQALAQAVRIQMPGRTDVMAPKGIHAAAIEHIPGVPGYLRGSVVRPDLMGNPLGLSQAARGGINLGTQKVAGPMLDPITQQMLQSRGQRQGLPLQP